MSWFVRLKEKFSKRPPARIADVTEDYKDRVRKRYLNSLRRQIRNYLLEESTLLTMLPTDRDFILEVALHKQRGMAIAVFDPAEQPIDGKVTPILEQDVRHAFNHQSEVEGRFKFMLTVNGVEFLTLLHRSEYNSIDPPFVFGPQWELDENALIPEDEFRRHISGFVGHTPLG